MKLFNDPEEREAFYRSLLILGAVAGFVLIAVSARGSEPPANVARVRVSRTLNADEGSGILIAPNRVLTCEHVVRDRGRVTVVINGIEIQAKVIRKTKVPDLALLEISPVLTTPVTFGTRPTVGQVITVGGFPWAGDYQERSGPVTGFVYAGEFDTVLNVVVFDTVIAQGASGGPVFDSKGRLVGIFFGGRDESMATDIEAIKKWLTD